MPIGLIVIILNKQCNVIKKKDASFSRDIEKQIKQNEIKMNRPIIKIIIKTTRNEKYKYNRKMNGH